MNIAIPEWRNNVSTVFDFAHWLLVIEADGINEINRTRIPINEKSFAELARKLVGLNVRILICNEISRQLEGIISSHGIKIVSHVKGLVNEVLNDYFTGKLNNSSLFSQGYSSRSNNMKSNDN